MSPKTNLRYVMDTASYMFLLFQLILVTLFRSQLATSPYGFK